MEVKKTLTDFVSVIDTQLAIYWKKEIDDNFGFNKKQKHLIKKILLHSREHNLRPAKRLRGSFVYFASKLQSKVPEKVSLQAAMAVELVHTALLMHDDVMDQDELRRGKPTTHKYFENGDAHYGQSMALNIGDALLSLGCYLLSACAWNNDYVLNATQHLQRTIAYTTYGQAYDITLEKLSSWEEDDVISLHRAKTAIYTYENPLFVGAILCGISDKKIFGLLHEYAMDGGVAFQLQDDILGVFGDPDKTGKSADSDLLQGKCTLLIHYVLKSGTPKQKKAVLNVWGKRKATQHDIKKAKQAIIDSRSYDYSKKISYKYAKKATHTAEKLRKFHLNKESIDFIQGIAQYMVTREV